MFSTGEASYRAKPPRGSWYVAPIVSRASRSSSLGEPKTVSPVTSAMVSRRGATFSPNQPRCANVGAESENYSKEWKTLPSMKNS